MSVDHLEESVLVVLEQLGREIGEDEFHMMGSILEDSGAGLGLEYQLKYWYTVDSEFHSEFGAVPYSPELHRIIETLVEQGKVERNPKDLIKISYVEGK